MRKPGGMQSRRTRPLRPRTGPGRVLYSALLGWVVFLGSTARGAPPTTVSTEPEPLEPSTVVRHFYDRLAEGDCEGAQQLRPDYGVDRCRDVVDVNLRAVEQIHGDSRYAVVFIDLVFRRASDAQAELQSFSGHLKLEMHDGRWLIDGRSFHSGSRADDVNYLRNVAKVFPVTPVEPEAPGASLAAAESAPVEPTDRVPSRSSPSNTLLSTLWTPEQLAGKPSDRRIVSLKSLDRTPPDRIEPAHGLPALPAERFGSIRRVAPRNGEKLVALTFDLCERADDVTGYDRDVVNALRAERVPATMFAGGKWMRSHPEKTMRLMADPLFEIGNHAWTHANFRMIDPKIAGEQIAWTQAQYEVLRQTLMTRAWQVGIGPDDLTAIPRALRVFRFPYGTCNPDALQQVASHGLAAIQWDVVSGDPNKSVSAAALTRTVLRGVRPGSIVVFHGNGRGWKTAEALPKIIDGLHAKGFQFVTVSKLLESGTPIATDTCYELKPDDNLRYDGLFGAGTKRQ